MRITLENKEIVIFDGAKVKDALRAYSLELWEDVSKKKTKSVVDVRGNTLSLDGELIEGKKLFIKNRSSDED